MKEKIIGYILLFLGIGVMVFCVINMSMVFANKIKPFSYFNIGPNQSVSVSISNIVQQMQGANQNILNSGNLPKINILSSESLNQVLNLSTQFLLMTFILGFGYRLASLGVQLIRPINVKLKSESQTPPLQS